MAFQARRYLFGQLAAQPRSDRLSLTCKHQRCIVQTVRCHDRRQQGASIPQDKTWQHLCAVRFCKGMESRRLTELLRCRRCANVGRGTKMYGVAVQCARVIVKGRCGRVSGELFRDQTVATRGIMLVSELHGRRTLQANRNLFQQDLSCLSLFVSASQCHAAAAWDCVAM